TNGCGTDQTTTSVTITGVGLDELTATSILLSPNPASTTLLVKGSNALVGKHIEIRDITGKKLSSRMATQAEMKIDVSSLSAGVYFVQVPELNISTRFIKK